MEKDGKSRYLPLWSSNFPRLSSVSPPRCFKNQTKRLQAALIIRPRIFDPISLIDTIV